MLSIVDEPDSLMLETEKPAVFEGTRWECEAFLNSFFTMQRKIVEGARSKASDTEWYDQLLDTLDKKVYRVTVTGLGVVADDAVRPENAYRAMRIQLALEMFDAIKNAAENTENVGE